MILKLKATPEDKSASSFIKFMMERQWFVIGGNFEIDDSVGKVLLEKFPAAFEKVK